MPRSRSATASASSTSCRSGPPVCSSRKRTSPARRRSTSPPLAPPCSSTPPLRVGRASRPRGVGSPADALVERAGKPPRRSPLVAGYRGGWFHPATGYSVPPALRLACHLSARPAGDVFDASLARLYARTERRRGTPSVSTACSFTASPRKKPGTCSRGSHAPGRRHPPLLCALADRARSDPTGRRAAAAGILVEDVVKQSEGNPPRSRRTRATARGDLSRRNRRRRVARGRGAGDIVEPRAARSAARIPRVARQGVPRAAARARLPIGGRQPGGHPRELPLVVESLHAGSLIIDDIEDDSAFRRGAAALHRRHGVPVAINAANWLYFWAQVLLARLRLPDAARLLAHERLAECLMRCHEGQALDLTVRVDELPQAQVPAVVHAITRLKTGAPARARDLSRRHRRGRWWRAARRDRQVREGVGVGLQMLDDVSGVLSLERRHKAIEDLQQRRATWVWAWLAMEPRARHVRAAPRRPARRDGERHGRLARRAHPVRARRGRVAAGARPARRRRRCACRA